MCFFLLWQFWPTVRKKLFKWSRKTLENSRLNAENLQNFWCHWNNLSGQWKTRKYFETEFFFKLFLEVQISYIQTITSINKLQKNLCTFTLMMGAVKLIIIKDNFSRQEKKAGLVILTGFTQHSSWVDQGRLGRNTRFWLLQLRLDLITFKVLPYSEIVVIGPNP